MQPNYLLRKRLALSGKIVVYIAMVISLFVLLGWGLFINFLKQFSLHGLFMNPLTALLFLLISISYLLLTNPDRSAKAAAFVRIIGLISIVCGSMVWAGYIFGRDFMVDKLLFREQLKLVHFGGMSFSTSFCFILYGIALLIFDWETSQKSIPVQQLVLITFFIGGFFFLGYIFRATSIIQIEITNNTAFFTALSNLFLSYAIFFARPDKGIAAEFSKTITSSRITSQIIPVLILFPFVYGWIFLNYPAARTNEGVSIMVMTFIIICGPFVYYNLVIINRSLKKQVLLEKEKEIFIQKELHLRDSIIKEHEYFIKESQKAGNIGSYSADFIKDFWQSSEVLDTIFGIDANYSRSVEGWLNIIHPDDREMLNNYLKQQVIGNHTNFNKEYRIIRKNDQETRWVRGLGKIKTDNIGNVISLIGTIQDITELKFKEHELIRLTEDLRSLTHYLLNIREEERKQIAKDIHDELGQNFIVLKMDAAWMMNHINDEKSLLLEKLREIKITTDETVKISRRLYNSIYPQMMEDVGLIETVKWNVKNYLKDSNLEIQIHSNVEAEKDFCDNHDICLTLFRIYQESFTNILRYAEAKKVTIQLNRFEGFVAMQIKDDGVGFEVDEIDKSSHFGLLGMRERVYALNGTIVIKSKPDNGTTIEVELPLTIAN